MIPFWHIAGFLEEVEEEFFSPRFYACFSDMKIQPSVPNSMGVCLGNLSNTKTKTFLNKIVLEQSNNDSSKSESIPHSPESSF